MILCGVAITGFSVLVMCDVVTRAIGRPWLWLQEVTMTFFIYGIFIGIAAATRRNDHLYLAVLAESMTRQPAPVLRDLQPAGGARRGRLHDLFRLPQFPRRLQKPAHAVDDAAASLYAAIPLCGVAGRAVHHRADGQRLAQRLRRSDDVPTRRGNRCDHQRRAHLPDGRSCSCSSATWACRWRSR